MRVVQGHITREDAVREVGTYNSFKDAPHEKHLKVVDAAVNRYKAYHGMPTETSNETNRIPVGQAERQAGAEQSH